MLYIFDKDGTICQSKSGQKFINSSENQILIPGVSKKCAWLRKKGHDLAIASNQGGVGFGHMKEKDALALVSHAALLIKAKYFQMCPYHPDAIIEAYRKDSIYRKPRPGMLWQIMLTLNYFCEDTIFIGDMETDRQAAQAAGIEFIWAEEFFNRQILNI